MSVSAISAYSKMMVQYIKAALQRNSILTYMGPDANHLKFAASVLDGRTYFLPADSIFNTGNISTSCHISFMWPVILYKIIMVNYCTVYKTVKEQ